MHVISGSFPPGLEWFFFLVSTLVALVFLGVPLLAVGVSVWWATFRARRDAPGWLARRARAGRLTGIGVGALIGIMMSWFGLGLLAPAALGVGYLSGVLIAELLAVRPPSGPLRVASLQPRNARRYLPRWAVPLAVTAGALAIAGPFATPAAEHLASPDTIPAAVLVPMTLIAALALVLGGVALRRVELVPSAAEGGPDSDEVARRNTARAVVGAVVAIELLLLAALMLLFSRWLITNVAALGLTVAAVLFWCVLGWWKRVPPPEQALVQAGPRPPEPPSFRASMIA